MTAPHVWLLSISYGSDLDVIPCASEAAAREKLLDYVLYWWPIERARRRLEPLVPTDPEAAITAYFEMMDGLECAWISESDLVGVVHPGSPSFH